MLLNLTPRNHTKATWLTNTGASSSYETASGRAAETASNKMKTGPRTLSPRVLHRGTLLELTHHWIMDGDLQVPPKGSEKLGMVVPTGVPGLSGMEAGLWARSCPLYLPPLARKSILLPALNHNSRPAHRRPLATEGVQGSRNNTLPQKYGLCSLHVTLMWQKRKKKAVNPRVGSTRPLKRMKKSQFLPLH